MGTFVLPGFSKGNRKGKSSATTLSVFPGQEGSTLPSGALPVLIATGLKKHFHLSSAHVFTNACEGKNEHKQVKHKKQKRCISVRNPGIPAQFGQSTV